MISGTMQLLLRMRSTQTIRAWCADQTLGSAVCPLSLRLSSPEGEDCSLSFLVQYQWTETATSQTNVCVALTTNRLFSARKKQFWCSLDHVGPGRAGLSVLDRFQLVQVKIQTSWHWLKTELPRHNLVSLDFAVFKPVIFCRRWGFSCLPAVTPPRICAQFVIQSVTFTRTRNNNNNKKVFAFVLWFDLVEKIWHNISESQVSFVQPCSSNMLRNQTDIDLW